MRRSCLALVAGILLLLIPAASAAPPSRVETDDQAEAIFLAHPDVERWMRRYPRRTWRTSSIFRAPQNVWEIGVYSGNAGQTAAGEVDRDGRVLEALVGPQVAWPLARGGGIGGAINQPVIWISLCLLFMIGLADFRRPLSMRNLDVLALLSFSVHLWYFNEGRVFAGAIAAAATLVYLIARTAWMGWTNRASPAAARLPVWLLVGATVLLLGFRAGLNVEQEGVLDVGTRVSSAPTALRTERHRMAGSHCARQGDPAAGAVRRARSPIGSSRTDAARRRTRSATLTGR
jgi:hypothetical protein